MAETIPHALTCIMADDVFVRTKLPNSRVYKAVVIGSLAASQSYIISVCTELSALVLLLVVPCTNPASIERAPKYESPQLAMASYKAAMYLSVFPLPILSALNLSL